MSEVFFNWDSGLSWDTDLFWDESGPSTGNVAPYLALVTSEHSIQPNYMTMLAGVFQPLADLLVTLSQMPSDYDLDAAVGEQLDVVGQWVGASRGVSVPLTGVFFSWDVLGLGWSQGNWAPGPDATELVELDDADYLTLIRATIAANQWDGTIPGAYTAWNALFAGTGTGILIQDYNDMSMGYALTGPLPSAVTIALFSGGYLNLKPAGVRIRYYLTPYVPNTPYFGWSVEGPTISGWGVGYWGNVYPGS